LCAGAALVLPYLVDNKKGRSMPKLIHLYITQVAIGFAIALAFVTGFVALDLGGLRHLVLETEMGWLAFVMLVMFHGVVFAGVQFAIAIMRMAEPEDRGPKRGSRAPVTRRPAPVAVPASGSAQVGGRNRSSRVGLNFPRA